MTSTSDAAGSSAVRTLVPRVEASRLATVEKVADVLLRVIPDISPKLAESVDGSAKRSYTLVHHAYEMARRAAAGYDGEAMAAIAKLLDAVRVATPSDVRPSEDDHVFVVPSDRLQTLEDAGADMPIWTLSSDALMTRDERIAATAKGAFATAGTAGYGPLLEAALGAVITLKWREPTEATSSWTVNRLPGTVFTDVSRAPELFAKELVHEGSHAFLNDCFIATEQRFPDPQPHYWSPWKEAARPAFGIVHASLAFSSVTNLLVRIAEMTSDSDVAAYCERRVPTERERLRDAEPGIRASLTLVQDEAVRALVEAELGAALG